MNPHYEDDQATIFAGDCLDALREMPDASVDAVVTDPPYSLSFMSARWDTHDTPLGFQQWCEQWAAECLRVLKPGGHMLAFGGTRTWHRLACAVEDAGFEVRDSIAWLYGSGFPKSLDVSKAIDKAGGDPLAFRKFARAYATAVASSPLTHSDIDRHLGVKSSSCYWEREDHRGKMPPRHHWEQVRDLLGLDEGFSNLYDEAEREVVGTIRNNQPGGTSAFAQGGIGEYQRGDLRERDVHGGPATPAAQQWQGWGTALKPSHESIVVARKPLAGTVASNVIQFGSGALNIDGTRVGARWPTNAAVCEGASEQLGEAAAFFPTFKYQAKAPTSERPKVNGIAHPTTKPLALMRWLVRLVTPRGGVVLDPFAGSGTTIEAAILEGFQVIGIEREADYLPLIEARIARNRITAEGVPLVEGDVALFPEPVKGRWPTNVVMDRATAAELDEQSGILTTNPGTYRRRREEGRHEASSYSLGKDAGTVVSKGDSGGASRFFPVFDADPLPLWDDEEPA